MKRFLAVGLLLGCGDVAAPKADAKPADSNGTDTTSGPDGASPRCDPTKPFGTPTALANVNSTADDTTPFLSPDELQLWFSSTRTGGAGVNDIYMATRTSTAADFGAPARVAGVNTAGNDTRPTLTADGLNIYIEYQASPPSGVYKITSSTRASTMVAFGTPSEVTALSINTYDDAEFVLPDHSAIYFQSSGNIYRSARVNGSFQTPMLADGTNLNIGGNDYMTLLPDDKKMYFLSGRAGGAGGTDNWMTTRSTTVQAFGEPVNVSELNAPDGYNIFFVTADDCVAYLAGPGQGIDLYIAKKPL